MPKTSWQVGLAALVLSGCGYVGEPLPPALKRPVRVTDLAAIERGSKIIIQFTIPKVTTENMPIKGEPDIELRLGPAESPFQMAEWERTAERVPVDAKGKSVAQVEVPAAKFIGKAVVIVVNVHGKGGRTAGLSNFVRVPVVPALPQPEGLEATDAPDAVQLEWHAAAPEFRVFRRLDGETDWTQLGTSPKPSYTDGTIEYGKTYQYLVQAIEKTEATYAESELSEAKTFKPLDKSAPAVPAGLSAVPGTRSIELVWDRNTEKDFASYTVYRDGKKLLEGLTAPAYSDRDAKPGVRYEYQVSSVDTAANESTKSPVAATVIPQ